MRAAIGRFIDAGGGEKRGVNRVRILRIDHQRRNRYSEGKATARTSKGDAAIRRSDRPAGGEALHDVAIRVDRHFERSEWMHDAPRRTAVAALVKSVGRSRKDLLRVPARHAHVAKRRAE